MPVAQIGDGLLPLTGARYSSLRYRISTLEAIQSHAHEKFLSIPRGGLEVGGLLLGEFTGDTIEISGSEEFEIEYTSGPSYCLSKVDIDRLRERLRGGSRNVVGWWHSHTRSEIDLSEEDLGIHRTLFPDAHSVALVVKPYKCDHARFAVYLPNGTGNPFTACGRLTLDESQLPAPPRNTSAMPVAAPLPLPPEVSRRRWAPWVIGSSAAVLVLLGVASWMTQPAARPPAPERLGLSVSDSGDHLTVRWNQHAQAIQSSIGGELFVVDGTHMSKIPLDVDSLNGGTIAYIRRTGNVEVRLRAQSRDNELHEDVARFTGPEPKPAEPASAPVVVKEAPVVQTEQTRARKPAPILQLPSRIVPQTPAPSVAVLSPPSIAIAESSSPSAPAVSRLNVPPAPLSRGRAIWTGVLPRGGVLSFNGRSPSSGAITGHLPEGPSRVRIYAGELRETGIVVYTPADKERTEKPSVANGWNVTTYLPDAKRASDVAVLETPSPANNWQRIVVRSERRPISVLMLEWEEVAR